MKKSEASELRDAPIQIPKAIWYTQIIRAFPTPLSKNSRDKTCSARERREYLGVQPRNSTLESPRSLPESTTRVYY